MTKQDCIFCKISNGQIPSKIIEETETVFVIKDIAPEQTTHLLIIPKLHVRNMKDVDPHAADSKLCLDMFAIVKKLSTRLKSETQSFKLACNNEAAAGQAVFHLHWHFLSKDEMSY